MSMHLTHEYGHPIDGEPFDRIQASHIGDAALHLALETEETAGGDEYDPHTALTPEAQRTMSDLTNVVEKRLLEQGKVDAVLASDGSLVATESVLWLRNRQDGSVTQLTGHISLSTATFDNRYTIRDIAPADGSERYGSFGKPIRDELTIDPQTAQLKAVRRFDSRTQQWQDVTHRVPSEAELQSRIASIGYAKRTRPRR